VKKNILTLLLATFLSCALWAVRPALADDSLSSYSSFEKFAVSGGHTYAITKTPMNWNDAKQLAELQGGYLVTVDDAAESQFLVANFGADNPWIGLNDIQSAGNWVWANGAPLTYASWAPGEPSGGGTEHCVMTNWGTPGAWNNGTCSDLRKAIVEWNMLTTINFDDASSGTVVDSRYSGLGVTFGCFNGTTPDNLCTGHAVAAQFAGAESAPNVIALGNITLSAVLIDERTGYLKASFSPPVNWVSIAAMPMLPPEYMGSTTNKPFLQAFNSSGQWLGTAEYTGSVETGGWENLTITRPTNDISYIAFSSYHSGGGYAVYGAFDNLRFPALAPDLIVQSIVTNPVTPAPGQNASVTVTVKNQGNGAAGGFYIDFYKDRTTAPAPHTVGDFYCYKSTLAAGASDTCTGAVSYGSAGTYKMWAQVDTEQGVSELYEDNNVYGPKSIVVQSASANSDLTITAVTGPTTGVPGSTINIGDTTKNNGPGSVPASTTKYYWSTNNTWDAGDTYLGSRAVPALAALATSQGSITVTVPSNACSGTFYIIAKADADNLIAETKETNNTKYKSIKTGPDLIVSAITAPTTSGGGKLISVTDTTKNQGGCPAVASTTKLYLSTNSKWDTGDTYLGERAVGSLAAGATNSGSTSVTIPAVTAGTYYIIAKADANNTNPTETNENNNTKSKSIKIGPDLVVSAITAPTSAVRGSTIKIKDTTKNSGGGDVGVQTATKLYLSTNSTWDAGDTYLGSRTVPALTAGTSNAVETSVIIPSGIATGTYYIIAVSDANKVVVETNETNNNKAKTITIN
jgi:subtilase family serine protease